MRLTEKLTAQHRQRRAYVYIRQSDPKQVRQNLGSQYNQYALVQRAVDLGWLPEQVQVIDDDQGHSSLERDRHGFQELMSEVALGNVGIVLAYEASRLARNNADWYRLLDIAVLMDTLIADADGIYDPQDYNDRLLLGLRGMLSEAELHLLQLRLKEGRLRRVERGEYRHHLPTGLTRLPDGRVVKDPDVQVQHALELVFERFATLGSARQVLRHLTAQQVLLPRHQTSGFHAGQLLWKRPSESAIHEILSNPAYAGAFVYGRRPVAARNRSQRRRQREPWPVVRQGMYPAYISWEQYLANQARLRQNSARYAEHRRGAVRQGKALLAGLAICGRCGHHMYVAYRGQRQQARYCCSALLQNYAGSVCQYLTGEPIEQVVVAAFFEAMQPAELDLLAAVSERRQAEHTQLGRQLVEQVKRAEYEAHLAAGQYDAVDPDNRLVAAELERRWEAALRAVAGAKEAVQRWEQQPFEPALAPDLAVQLADLSHRLPALWQSGKLRPEQQKELLRTLIEQVILTRTTPDTVAIRIVWVSGAVSHLTVHPPIHRAVDVHDYDQLVERIGQLSEEGYPDVEIARRLTAEGFRSARTAGVPASLVGKLRGRQGQTSVLKRLSSREKVDGSWTVYGLARALGVDRHWIYNRIVSGALPAIHYRQSNYYVILDDPNLMAHLKAQAAAEQHM
jgi:DNA invertase Pin-like site-specific DNA recombinase